MSEGGRRKRETSSDIGVKRWRERARWKECEGFTCRKMSNADKERCKDAAKSANLFKILRGHVHVKRKGSQVTPEP